MEHGEVHLHEGRHPVARAGTRQAGVRWASGSSGGSRWERRRRKHGLHGQPLASPLDLSRGRDEGSLFWRPHGRSLPARQSCQSSLPTDPAPGYHAHNHPAKVTRSIAEFTFAPEAGRSR